ncbi:hypothetical protein ABZY68_17130 [Streptomyces sp. NPDC006482]|uniref:hypothetical protein n=1 Tax=Streptomyces sp. NPDC006482 TaxID=3154306 RepID=UPI0033BCD0F8
MPAGGAAEEVDLDALRGPLSRRRRHLLPDVDDEVVRHLVDRREARRRGADTVRFIGARTEEARSPHGPTSIWTRRPARPRSRT